MVNNNELKVNITKYRDEVNNVRYRLNNVEKSQKDMSDKIDKLLEGESKIDKLIQQGKRLLELSESRWDEELRKRDNDKNETTRRLDEHSEKIEQLTERIDALFAEPLTYRRPPQSPESQNLEDQGHQEIPKVIFSRNMHNSNFKIEITKSLKRSYRNMMARTIGELSSGSTKWTEFLNQTSR
jgi:chromosome segregation ATPase